MSDMIKKARAFPDREVLVRLYNAYMKAGFKEEEWIGARINKLLDIDPTSDGLYMDWLVAQDLKAGGKYNPSSSVVNTLAKLHSRFKSHHLVERILNSSEPKLIEVLTVLDPTNNGGYMQWLINNATKYVKLALKANKADVQPDANSIISKDPLLYKIKFLLDFHNRNKFSFGQEWQKNKDINVYKITTPAGLAKFEKDMVEIDEAISSRVWRPDEMSKGMRTDSLADYMQRGVPKVETSAKTPEELKAIEEQELETVNKIPLTELHNIIKIRTEEARKKAYSRTQNTGQKGKFDNRAIEESRDVADARNPDEYNAGFTSNVAIKKLNEKLKPVYDQIKKEKEDEARKLAESSKKLAPKGAQTPSPEELKKIDEEFRAKEKHERMLKIYNNEIANKYTSSMMQLAPGNRDQKAIDGIINDIADYYSAIFTPEEIRNICVAEHKRIIRTNKFNDIKKKMRDMFYIEHRPIEEIVRKYDVRKGMDNVTSLKLQDMLKEFQNSRGRQYKSLQEFVADVIESDPRHDPNLPKQNPE